MLSVSFSTMIPVSEFQVLKAYEAYVEVVEEVGFKQKRMEGVPVSGPILCEKAVELSKGLHGEGATFSASEGAGIINFTMATCPSMSIKEKRKRVVLSISDKIDIIKYKTARQVYLTLKYVKSME